MVVEGDNFVYLENFVVYHFDFDTISVMLQVYVLLMILCNMYMYC